MALHKTKLIISVVIVLMILGRSLEVQAQPYSDTVTVEGTVYRPGWEQSFPVTRTDALYLVMEKVDPQNVWFAFGATLHIGLPPAHPWCASSRDSIGVFLYFKL